MGEGLDARQKGDIYWKKLKRYLEARSSLDDSSDEKDTARMLAKDVFECAKKLDASEEAESGRLVTGDEFKVMPPTATGAELYGNGILLVIANLRRIVRQLKAHEYDAVFLKHLATLGEIMQKALKSYYNSSGIDEKTGTVIASSKREEAQAGHAEIIKEYESEVKNFRNNVSNEVVKGLIKEYKIDNASKANAEMINDGQLDKLVGSNPEAYEVNKANIEMLRKEYDTLLAKEKQLESTLPLIREAAKDKMNSLTGAEWISPVEAYGEYRDYLAERLRALAYARRCCLAYVRCILTDETVDPLIANYIKKRWGAEVKTLPQDQPVVTFERFVRIKLLEQDNTEYRFDDVAAVKKAAAELKEYRNTHPEQFEDQTFSSLFFDIEELSKMERKARALRNHLASAASGRILLEVSDKEREELVDIWIEADAFSRVTSMVIDYAEESESKTIKALLPTFARDVYEMSFYRQKEISAQCLEKVIERRAR